MKVKYRVTIEFECDKHIKFPHDAQLIEAMQVQTESLEDGTISQQYKVSMLPGSIEVVKTMYSEFPDIEIPCSLLGNGWEDQSWHNDARPHSEYPLPDGSGIVVWVAEDNKEDRDHPEIPKFYAEWQPNIEEWKTDGRISIYEGESEFAMQAAITAFRLQRFADKVNKL